MALNLRDIVNDSSVENVTAEWKDVGVELEISKSKLDEIECNYSHVDARKREMFQYWLDNSENQSLEVVQKAIETVQERRRRAENRYQAESEERQAEGAIENLEELIEKFKVRNFKLKTDVETRQAVLEDEKKWMSESKSNQKKWKTNEELEATKQNVQNALRANRLQGNRFARQYLRQKYSLNITDLTEKEIEGYLRQALIHIESQQSSSVKDHYRQAKKHFKIQTVLKREITELQTLLSERTVALRHIRNRLVKLGVRVDAEIIVRLEEQEKIVGSVQRECSTLHKEADEVREYARDKVQEYNRELVVLIDSFNQNLKQLEAVLKSIGDSLAVLIKTLGGAAVGAGIGASIGAVILFPVAPVGAAIGGTLGAATGAITGFVYGAVNEAQTREKIERLKRSQTNFNEELERAENERDVLQALLRDYN